MGTKSGDGQHTTILASTIILGCILYSTRLVVLLSRFIAWNARAFKKLRNQVGLASSSARADFLASAGLPIYHLILVIEYFLLHSKCWLTINLSSNYIRWNTSSSEAVSQGSRRSPLQMLPLTYSARIFIALVRSANKYCRQSFPPSNTRKSLEICLSHT